MPLFQPITFHFVSIQTHLRQIHLNRTDRLHWFFTNLILSSRSLPPHHIEARILSPLPQRHMTTQRRVRYMSYYTLYKLSLPANRFFSAIHIRKSLVLFRLELLEIKQYWKIIYHKITSFESCRFLLR